jgi:hypothetical protein
MPIATKDLFKGRPLPIEDVPCPELGDGVSVRVRCLTALERDQYETAFWKLHEGKPSYDATGARARLVRLAAVDEQGDHLFTDDDLPMLCSFRGDVLDRLFGVAQRLSGLNATIEELKASFFALRAGSGPTR